MIDASIKVVVGTALYVVVLWVAARNPRAAGMMLTFPTLNGIGLLLAEPALLESVVHSMLLMPVLNGIFCASFLAMCRHLLLRGWEPRRTSAGLLLAISVVWVVVTATVAAGNWGVTSPHQWAYGLAVLAAGLVLTWMWPKDNTEGRKAGVPMRMASIIGHNRGRIVLFALSLGLVAAFERMGGSGTVMGILASLPLVAFFGLHSLVTDERNPLEARIATLGALAHGVWLGPAIAIFFVAAYWRGLYNFAQWANGAAYLAGGTAGLLAGWACAFAVIWFTAALLHHPPDRHRAS